MSGIAVTIHGAQGATQTVRCSSPANIAAINVTNNLFPATTAAGWPNSDSPGGESVAFSTQQVLMIANT